MKYKLLFFLATLVFGSIFLFAQDLTKADLKYLCSNQTISGLSPQKTIYDNLKANCNTSTLSSRLDLYIVKIKSGTKFTFTITPNEKIDFDFVSWLNPNLENVGLGDRGSSNNPHPLGIYSIGLELNKRNYCDDSGATSSGKVKYYDVVPGDIILIAVDRWEQIESDYSISFGGDAILDCSFNGNNYSACENNNEGEFNLTNIKKDILLKRPSNYTGKFYLDKNDATENNSNTINGTYFTVNKSESPKTIYLLLLNELNILARIEEITLNITEKLNFTPINLSYCAYSSTPTSINLLESIPASLPNKENFKFRFFKSKTDAETNQNEITNYTTYNASSNQIYIRTENLNDSECYTIQEFKIENKTTEITITDIINFCESLEPSGFIDLTELKTKVPGFNDYKLVYYESMKNIQNNISINNPESYKYTTTNGNIYIKATKNNECPVIFTITYKVNTVPTLGLKPLYLKCKGESITIDLSKYKGEIIIQGPHKLIDFNVFEINQPGKYSATITTEFDCTYQYTFTVEDNIAPILKTITITKDKVIFTVRHPHESELLFSMDKINWQTSKEFTLSALETSFTIYAKISNCIFELYHFENFVISNFFSPNNDGKNDTWKIKFPKNIEDYSVSIFDRFGKTIKTINSPSEIIWDGKLNGQNLPSDTYWYRIDLKENFESSPLRILSGNILLKR